MADIDGLRIFATMTDIKKEEEKSLNFLEEIVEEDLAAGRYKSILTRFPPKPNGYLHIGHSKSIVLNFGLAQKYGGKTNLRFDDTNPVTEDTEYVESIKEDIRWLGFEWENELYASDYFEQLYAFAEALIRKELAYVDDSSAEEIARMKGTPTEPGTDSPYRSRSVEENLRLFRDMRAGKYRDGDKVLRARVDMSAPNMQLRDPLMYRIKHAHHHRTGDTWCIYPMYDFAHGQSDSIEHITHSICTLEFVPHRPLYDWFIEKLDIFPSHQYEFARLNMTYTVMSKRKLLQLVNEGHVTGWDDPRMPTISGLRRRGYTPESIRMFAEKIGVAKRENLIDVSLLEFCVREHLNKIAPADRKERNFSLTGYSPRQQRLTRPRRPIQKHPLRDPRPQRLKPPRVLEKLLDLLQLLDRLVDASDVLEARLGRVRRHPLRPRLPETHHLRPAPLHLTHHEDPEPDQEQDRQEVDEHGGPGEPSRSLRVVEHLGRVLLEQIL